MPNMANSVQNLIHYLQMLQGCKHLLNVYVTLGIDSGKYIFTQSIFFVILMWLGTCMSICWHAYNPGHCNDDCKFITISSTLYIHNNIWQDDFNLISFCTIIVNIFFCHFWNMSHSEWKDYICDIYDCCSNNKISNNSFHFFYFVLHFSFFYEVG